MTQADDAGRGLAGVWESSGEIPKSQAVSVSSCQTASVWRDTSASVRPCPPSRTALVRSRHSIGAKGISSAAAPPRAQARMTYHFGPSSSVTTAASGDSLAHSSGFCPAQLSLVEGEAEGPVLVDCEGRATSGSVEPVVSDWVYDGTEPRVGVGSKRVQPTPSKYSSGQACASFSPTETELSPCGVPGAKPTATRAGMSSERAIAAIAKEKWTQKPCLSFRKRAIACRPLPTLTLVSYWKPPVTAKYSWSLTARS